MLRYLLALIYYSNTMFGNISGKKEVILLYCALKCHGTQDEFFLVYFSLAHMLAILWSSLKQVHLNNYYHGRKVSNYKSSHNENVLAINASGLLCRRRSAVKMLIELDLNVRLKEVMTCYEDQLSR